MNRNKALVVALFAVIFASGFQACTSKKGSGQGASSSAPQAQQTLPTKCPDGSDPIKVPGQCEGSWRAANAEKGRRAAAECHFVGQLVNCETMGYANFGGDGRNLCYGESVFPYGGQTVTSEQCLKKFGMPSHASKYTLGCCKK